MGYRFSLNQSILILFTCKNDKNEIFVCNIAVQKTQLELKGWLGKTTPDNIVRMLWDEITIRELITTNSKNTGTVFR